MANYILDTDICSYIMNNSSPNVLKNLELHQKDGIYITSITYTELLYGALRKNSKKIQKKIFLVFDDVDVIAFDKSAAIEHAKIRCKLEKNGTPIGNMDILIASCAVANSFVLVTNNVKHFSKIDNLQIQNWHEE